MKNAILAMLLSALVAACAASPAPVGASCDPASADACDDGLACAPTAVDDFPTCTKRCEVQGLDEDRPAGAPAQCPVDSACVDVPQGYPACLALCADDGSCEAGAPGYPFLDHPDVCVCIPWMEAS